MISFRPFAFLALFPLRLQPYVEEPSDGFGAAGIVILAGGPSIHIRHELI